MAIGPKLYHYDFLVDNKPVDTTETLKILGVTLDRKLNFMYHVKEQVKKACAKASALRRIRKFIPMDVMGRLYKAFILPYLFLALSDILANYFTTSRVLWALTAWCG